MEFVNTNNHRIYLKREAADNDGSVRVPPGAHFEAEGYVADQAQATNGVVKADEYTGEERPSTLSDGERVVTDHDDSRTPNQDRLDQVAEVRQAARQATQVPNSDRYTGEDGAVELTGPGAAVINAPSVGTPSTGAGNTVAEQIIPADDADSGAPAEGGGYDAPAEQLVEVDPLAESGADAPYVGGESTVAGGAEAGDGETPSGPESEPDEPQPEVNDNTDARGKPLEDLTKVELGEVAVSEGVEVEFRADGRPKAKNDDLVKAIKKNRKSRGSAITSDKVPQAS